MHLVICDIDGTVSDFSHREHLASNPNGTDQEKEDWKLFVSEEMIYTDTVYCGAKEAIHKFLKNSKIVFLTGRNEGLFDITRKWFIDKIDLGLNLNDDLIMRPIGNLDPPTVFKEGVIQKLEDLYISSYSCGRTSLYGNNVPCGCEYPVITAIDDDPYMLNFVYPKYCHVILKAPQCWDSLFSVESNLPPEQAWRK